MAYAAYSAQKEYSDAGDGFLGAASAGGALTALKRGREGHVTIDENIHVIQQREAEQRMTQERLARQQQQQLGEPDGDQQQMQMQQNMQQQPAGAQQRMNMSPALKGPAAPSNG